MLSQERALLAIMRFRGIKLETHNGELRFSGPRSAVSQEAIDLIRASKPALLQLLTRSNEPLPIAVEATLIQQRHLPPVIAQGAQTPNNCVRVLAHVSATLDQFKEAVRTVLSLHPMLGAHFVPMLGTCYAILFEPAEASIQWFDFTNYDFSIRTIAVEKIRRDLSHIQFDPEHGFVCSIAAINIDERTLEILLSTHTAVADGPEMVNFLYLLVGVLGGDSVLPRPSSINALMAALDNERDDCGAVDIGELMNAISSNYPRRASILSSVLNTSDQDFQSGCACLSRLELEVLSRIAVAHHTTLFVIILTCFARAVGAQWHGWNRLLTCPITLRGFDADINTPGSRANILTFHIENSPGRFQDEVAYVKSRFEQILEFASVPALFVRREIEHIDPTALTGWTDVWLNYLKYPLQNQNQNQIADKISGFDLISAPGENYQFKLYLWDHSAGLTLRYFFDPTRVYAAEANAVISRFLSELHTAR